MKKRLSMGFAATAALALTAGLLTPAQAATTVVGDDDGDEGG